MAYSDAKKVEAISVLASNGFNFQDAHEKTGIPKITLKRWARGENRTVNDTSIINDTKKDNDDNRGIAELLEIAIAGLLKRIGEIPAGQLHIALGILLDKWILIQGGATSRNESIITNLNELPQDDKNAIIAEAERILARATGGGVVAGRTLPAPTGGGRAALARFAPRSMGDSESPGTGEGFVDGETVGEIGHG